MQPPSVLHPGKEGILPIIGVGVPKFGGQIFRMVAVNSRLSFLYAYVSCLYVRA